MRLLHHNLLESANRWPDGCAMRLGDADLSYADLARRAGAVARWLIEAGVRPGDRVALLFDAGPDYAAACYGVMMSGAAVLGLNAASRADDLFGVIRHGECRALVVDAAHTEASRLVALAGPAVRVLARHTNGIMLGDDLAATFAGDAGDPPGVALSTDSLAALIYTSGTTGRPKAVMLSHRNLTSNTESILEYLQLGKSDSIVSVLPFYYSYGASVLHTHIAAGARIVVEANLVFPHRVVATMVRERATGFAGVPSTFALLTGRVQLGQYDLSSLRYLTQAGGPMSPAMTERVRKALPQARLFVMYGQTEAAARLTYLPPVFLDAKPGSVGVAIPGVRIEIRGDDGTPLPAGEPGEVWANGPNIMLGYWKDSDATNSVLVKDWLRTGDSGRMDAEGFLYLDGRRSDIIKVGAHRVYPRDIEAAIEELDTVAEVAVVGEEDATLGQVVKACIVLAQGATLDESAVKAHCRARLAGYKIPKIVEFIATLPRTSSGKVRRQLLTSNRAGP
ncbi:MAG: AMP-binding protein [Pseudomonadota bacterium]